LININCNGIKSVTLLALSHIVQMLVLQMDEQPAVVNSLTDDRRKESAKVTEYRSIT